MPRKMIGKVVSSLMDRTAVVQVERFYLNTKYRKILKRRTNHKAHDHHNICAPGDIVELAPTRRISKNKAFAVVNMVKRQPQVNGEPFQFARLAGGHPNLVNAKQDASGQSPLP